ncbi:hypothetical protein AB0G49_14360 [Streptomyces longwoodensis]|uniref:hypothetical protein n=1 Tax=Streptomyces longwoodensis TaxID=68231 RepID=UPI00341156EC
MTKSDSSQAIDATRAAYEQARQELTALTPARDQLLTAVAAYQPPDVKAAARLGVTWKQLAAIARATTGVTAPWRSLPHEERAAAAQAAGIPHPAGLLDKAARASTAYNEAHARTRAALDAVYAALREDAAREVADALAPITDPVELRTAVGNIAEQAFMEMAALKKERDQHLASAALYEYREGLAADFGVSYLTMLRVVSRALGTMADSLTPGAWPTDPAAAARAAGIPHIPDAADRGIPIAWKYAAAEARYDAARVRREPAKEAVRLAGGRVQVPAPELPDFAEIRRRATEEIRAEFAALAVEPEDRLRRAADAVDQAEDEKALLLAERDQALASLAFYTTVRAPYRYAGISQQGMLRVLARVLGLPRGASVPTRKDQPAAARAAGIPFQADAHEELPKIAAVYEAADARRTAAIEIRTAAMRALNAKPYGWSQPRLAEFIGRDVAAVNRALTGG